jgi:TonB family protein
MKPTILLFCASLLFGQNNSSAPESKAQPSAGSAIQQAIEEAAARRAHASQATGTPGGNVGAVTVLSDTQGVDFRPYLQRILRDVRDNWYRLIPESAEMNKGKLAIEFAIMKDGKVADMRLVDTSGCQVLDRAAWGGITGSSPFPPLPSEFTAPYLALRFRFSYNPNRNDSDTSVKGCDYAVKVDLAHSGTKTKSGIAVSISPPALSDLEVPLGGSKVVTAVVTGAESNENTVRWSISGFGCSGTSCGEMTKDSYHAPTIMPSSPFVTLTAVSTADPSAKASVTLHIVGSNASQ